MVVNFNSWGLKIQISTFFICAGEIRSVGLLPWNRKRLLIVKNFSVTLFKCLLRHSGSRLWFCKLFCKPKMKRVTVTVLLFKITGGIQVHFFCGAASVVVKTRKNNNDWKFWCASVKISELVSVFIEASRNLKSIFLTITMQNN
jgi:hypothetical protein